MSTLNPKPETLKTKHTGTNSGLQIQDNGADGPLLKLLVQKVAYARRRHDIQNYQRLCSWVSVQGLGYRV